MCVHLSVAERDITMRVCVSACFCYQSCNLQETRGCKGVPKMYVDLLYDLRLCAWLPRI